MSQLSSGNQLTKAGLKAIGRASGVLLPLFIIADMASGKPPGQAIADNLAPIDSETNAMLREAGQEVVKEFVDGQRRGVQDRYRRQLPDGIEDLSDQLYTRERRSIHPE